jgi:DNA-directed RNA polymerase subunit RPC12/RpoP/flagellar basal body-associated protein FliL
MTKSGRLIGILLVGAGIVVCLAGSLVSFYSTRSAEVGANQSGGLVLGIVISVIIAIPLVGAGVYLTLRGRAEEADMADSSRQRKILDMVKTRGQVNVNDLVLELKTPTAQVRDDIYRLVGLGLFTGYVNWNSGILYSVEASKLTGNKCPNCGGEQEFAGKGVITCKYCGSQIFL